MTQESLLREFPVKRIKPVDGMAVTAQVWEEAHDYHRQYQRFHSLLSHGEGIVAGLEVIASEPADHSVYILPGIAVDSAGQAVVLAEPQLFNIGRAIDGLLYLFITHGESAPRGGGQTEGLLYIHSEFGIEAKPALPATPYVELARIRRQGRESVLVNAANPARPGANEIDLRFRREIGAQPQQTISLAVCYAGGGKDAGERHGRGAGYLAEAFNHSSRERCRLDDNVPLAPGLEYYTLVYLVGLGAFKLSVDEMNALYAYLQSGGTILMESCRRAVGEPASDAGFLDLLSSFGVRLEQLQPGHRLLTTPHLFAAPPAGFENQGAPKLTVGEGVLLSTFDYGCVWQGERRGGAATREEIRSALEWGNNIVAYALDRRAKKT